MKLLVLVFAIILILASVKSKDVDGLKVQGRFIVNGEGKMVKLRGVNRSGTEYYCVQGHGIFDGPHDVNVINAMKSWGINAVRVPLNEQCWLGYNGITNSYPAYTGNNYINAIKKWVDDLYNLGNFAVILELHWAAAGTGWANYQYPMPNRDHSITFWTQVADTFKNRSYVIFEPYNEPFPDNNQWNSEEGWRCWRDGGSCNGMSFQAAGMQELVTAIRSRGAKNIIGLGGISYSNSLARWEQYKPNDPLNNLVAVWHSYSTNICNTKSCWDQYITPLATKYPVFATEIGQYDCNSNYIKNVMTYLDSIYQNYLGWTWNVWDCSSGPALISNDNGTPTNFGLGFKNHIYGQTSTIGYPPNVTTPSTTPSPSTTTTTPSPTSPSTTPSPSGSSTTGTYSLSWCSCNNDWWTQVVITPAPTQNVMIDCGYGPRNATAPYGPGTYILGNTGIQCNTNKVVVVHVGTQRFASKSDGTGKNNFAPSTVTYSLSWCTCNNDYWVQADVTPNPTEAVYIDCGYGAYPVTTPYGPKTIILGNTNRQCKSTREVSVYIGSTAITSKWDGTGTNVGRSLASNVNSSNNNKKGFFDDPTLVGIVFTIVGLVVVAIIVIIIILVVKSRKSNDDYIPLQSENK